MSCGLALKKKKNNKKWFVSIHKVLSTDLSHFRHQMEPFNCFYDGPPWGNRPASVISVEWCSAAYASHVLTIPERFGKHIQKPTDCKLYSRKQFLACRASPYPVRLAASSTGPPDLQAPIELPLDDQSARRGACRLCDFSRSGSLWHVVVSPNQSDCR